MKLAPSTSASRPCTERRHRSIWNSRSCACTNPCAKKRSSSFAAVMCGMPAASRITVTGSRTPSTTTVPDGGGRSGDASGGRAGGSPRHPATMPSSAPTEAARARLRSMALKDGLIAEYDHEIATTRRLLERVPDDKLSWKPHPKSMSIGGLAQHIANLPNWGSMILEQAAFDLADAPPNLSEPSSRAAVLSFFEKSTAGTRKQLDRSDAELMALWTLKREGHEVFTMPRVAAFRSFVLNHLIHHRG